MILRTIYEALIDVLLTQILAYFLTYISSQNGWSANPAVLHYLIYFSVFTFRDRRAAGQPATSGGANAGFYDLEHYKLNLRPPIDPAQGWEDGTDDFPTACERLLLEVLRTAGILPSNGTSLNAPPKRVNLLDLGYGCGDQILALVRAQRPSPADHPTFHLDRYVGVTLDATHHRVAQSRVTASLPDASPSLRLFRADAAAPATWPPALTTAVAALRPVASRRPEDAETETWVLALDALYHFAPSRRPVLSHARHELKADGLMAFDLLLADGAPRAARLAMAVVERVLGCPPGAFVTEAGYRAMLAGAGWREVEVREVSGEVFGPLGRFMDRQGEALRGVGMGLGKLGVARWLFGWWGRTGVVRGVIVVARAG